MDLTKFCNGSISWEKHRKKNMEKPQSMPNRLNLGHNLFGDAGLHAISKVSGGSSDAHAKERFFFSSARRLAWENYGIFVLCWCGQVVPCCTRMCFFNLSDSPAEYTSSVQTAFCWATAVLGRGLGFLTTVGPFKSKAPSLQSCCTLFGGRKRWFAHLMTQC